MVSDMKRKCVTTHVDFILLVLPAEGKCWLVKGKSTVWVWGMRVEQKFKVLLTEEGKRHSRKGQN